MKTIYQALLELPTLREYTIKQLEFYLKIMDNVLLTSFSGAFVEANFYPKLEGVAPKQGRVLKHDLVFMSKHLMLLLLNRSYV